MKLSYAYIIEGDQGKVIASFKKDDLVAILEEIHEGNFSDTLDMLEELLSAKVRRNG